MPTNKHWSKKDIPDLTGKLAIVTGSTGGLGYETALALAEAKATVIVAGRNDAKGKDALDKILSLVPEAKITFEIVDLGSLESVKKLSKLPKKKYVPFEVYSQSKLANLLFTLELQRRSEEAGWGLVALSAHPGWSRTDLLDNGPGTNGFQGNLIKLAAPLFSQDGARGAEPQIYAATSPDVKPGGYYGPNGCFEMKGAVAPARLTHEALDKEAAKKLWDMSTKLTGVTWA